MARTDGANHYASRQPVLFRQVFVVDPVDAQRAFLHHAGVFVELASTVRASPGAQFAADADVFVDQHDPVLGALVGRAGRAHGDAGRLLAMQAGFREIDGARALPVAFLVRVDAVEPDAPGLRAIGVEIGQRSPRTAGIPLLAGGGTGVAAYTDIEVDDEPELLLARSRLRQRGHGLCSHVAAVRARLRAGCDACSSLRTGRKKIRRHQTLALVTNNGFLSDS